MCVCLYYTRTRAYRRGLYFEWEVAFSLQKQEFTLLAVTLHARGVRQSNHEMCKELGILSKPCEILESWSHDWKEIYPGFAPVMTNHLFQHQII